MSERRSHSSPLTIALVNNMPDAELRNTELQFRNLLAFASRALGIPVRLRIFAIPEVVRTGDVRQPGEDIAQLWRSEVDGLIVTGMEPRAPALQDEPYWGTFAELVGWAAEHTRSAIWSCLAAHASVLALDGVRREPFPSKLFGVFCSADTSDEETFFPGGAEWFAPHSRWNGLPHRELARSGYRIWSNSLRTGPDIIVKQLRSLFLFVQGHPEYDGWALLREYWRDVGRWLRGKSERYPEIPENYLAQRAVEALLAFRTEALLRRGDASLAPFPEIPATHLLHSWRDAARSFYTGWLEHVESDRRGRRASAPTPHKTIRRHADALAL
ncbi:MAG: homoserine O-acetyltransferase/O-succinyltransferase family protein [Rhizomicrobium sp.]